MTINDDSKMIIEDTQRIIEIIKKHAQEEVCSHSLKEIFDGVFDS